MRRNSACDGKTERRLVPVKVVAPHRRRRWAKTDATQQRILRAAIAGFRERGYSAATIGGVMMASGASIGSI